MSVATPPALGRVGGSYYSNAAIGVSTTVTPITAGANVNGAVIRTLVLNPGGVNIIGLYWNGSTRLFYIAPAAAAYTSPAQLPLLIPPGQSVDIVNGGGAAGQAFMSYDLL